MNTEIPSTLAGARVRSLREAAALLGVSISTIRREVRAGTGPKLVRLSPRRVGISEADLAAWLQSRRQSTEAA